MDDPDYKSEIESYRIENDNLKREKDRQTVDYELKLEQLRKEIHTKTSNYEELMKNYQEIEIKFKNSCDDKISLNQVYHDLSKEKFEVIKKCNTLESDYSTITELISHRENELLAAKSEINELKSKLNQYKVSEIDMKLNERDLEYRKKDFVKLEEMSSRRNKRLSDDIKSLQDKLAEANKEIFEERTKYNTAVFDNNLALENKRNEIKNLKKLNEKLKENVLYLEKVYEEKTESLRSALEGKSNVDSVLRKELNAQKSINALIKEERDELLEKQSKFIETISELQEAFRSNCDDNLLVKEECEEKLEEKNTLIADLRKILSEKEIELQNANELLEKFRVKSLSEEELKSLNPATTAAIGALKRGFSLTQIYSEYLQVVCERNELKVDRDRLNEYVELILEELEEKSGPSMKKLEEERSIVELSMSTISGKYEKTLSDLFDCQREIEELRCKNEDFAKKMKREEQMCVDLKQQVCYLLREIETLRGTVVKGYGDNDSDREGGMVMRRMKTIHQQSNLRRSYSSLNNNNNNNNSMDSSNNQLMTANDVITTHLVTFKNICELQQQNIHLVTQMRDLSSQLETQDGLINEQSLHQMAKKLETALLEVDQLREKVKKIKQLEKIIDRQRHIIQALTTLTGNADLSELIQKTPLSLDCSDSTSQSLISFTDRDNKLSSTIVGENKEEINEKLKIYEEKIDNLQGIIDILKEEKDSLRETHIKATEELSKQIVDLKVLNENLQVKISCSQEKGSTLEQNLVNRQLEMSDLQEELLKSNNELIKNKEEIKTVKNELLSTLAKIKNYEANINELRSNLKHVETLEEQICQERNEKYELMKSTNNLAIQISNLQNTVLSSSRVADDDQCSDHQQSHLKSRIKQLALELKQEKSKYQTSQEMWQSKINEHCAKIDSLSAQLSSSVLNKPSVEVVIERQKSPEKREKLNNLEEQIEELSVANVSLKMQLERYEEILCDSEAKLLANSNLMEQLQIEFQEKINDEKKKSENLEEMLRNVQNEHEKLEVEYKTVRETLEDKKEELEGLLDESRGSVVGLEEEIKKLKETESLLKIDIVRQRQLTKEAMDNYQQELIFHSQESDSLQEINDELRRYQSQERDLSQKLKEALLERDRLESELTKREEERIEERRVLESEVEELRRQRESLGSRLVEVNEVVVSLRRMVEPTVDMAVVMERENDWTEVIQYLRQEKEIAENSKNQLEMDIYRLKNDNKLQEETIAKLNTIIEEERKFKIIESETNKHHGEIMRKLESVQMLSESNVMLRKDRERLREELSDALEKVKRLQDTVEPLREQLRTVETTVETVGLELRSVVSERDLWRQRCDCLIEKSKQVNPEDFRKICIEKDDLQRSLLMEQEKQRSLTKTLTELKEQLNNHQESLRNTQDNLTELRRVQEDNSSAIQKRDCTISQLKELARKYKAEKEVLSCEMNKLTEIKEGQSQEILNINKHLQVTKTSLEESLSKLRQSETNIVNQEQTQTPENTMRLKIVENKLAHYMAENETLRNTIAVNRQSRCSCNVPENIEEGNNTVTVATDQSSLPIATHSLPSIARVSASVQPVLQKQISPQSSSSSSQVCPQTARQTAEIRPIPAVIINHSAPVVTSSSTENTSNNNSEPITTTSLPANVVQALQAASSVVFYPSSSTASSVPRQKRQMNEPMTVEQSSGGNIAEESCNNPKKIKLMEESGHQFLEEHQEEEEQQQENDNDEEEEEEDIDDVALEEDEEEEENFSEEDYEDDDEEDEDEDDVPECIELSSDGQSNGDEDDNEDNDNEEGDNQQRDEEENIEEDKEEEEQEVKEDNEGGENSTNIDESKLQQQDSNSEARKKIEPITWSDMRESSDIVSTLPSTSSAPSSSNLINKRIFSKALGGQQQVKSRPQMFETRRKINVAHRRQYGARGGGVRLGGGHMAFRRGEFPRR